MLNNYQYFIAICEEGNLSRAAEKMFISHQCLSKYLKTLEQEYHMDFFERSPSLTLTPAGEAYLEMARNLELLEQNLDSHLKDIREAKTGKLCFGTTEGRYRILIPKLLTEYKALYPGIDLITSSGSSRSLCTAVLENKLDLALVNAAHQPDSRLQVTPVLEEQLYLVISDKLLAKYFPEEYPDCCEVFSNGIDLNSVRDIPIILGRPGLNMRKLLEEQFKRIDIEPKIAAEIGQSDLQYLLTARDYAVSFCWSMFLPAIQKENLDASHGKLYAFPLKDRPLSNSLVLVTRKGKQFSHYGKDFIRLVKNTCCELVSVL